MEEGFQDAVSISKHFFEGTMVWTAYMRLADLAVHCNTPDEESLDEDVATRAAQQAQKVALPRDLFRLSEQSPRRSGISEVTETTTTRSKRLPTASVTCSITTYSV